MAAKSRGNSSEKLREFRPASGSWRSPADLFYRHGIRAVGVDAIAEAAGTNKMTLYRHFSSKDELVAEYLRQAAKGDAACWERLQAEHPGDALAQLRAWLNEMAEHVVSLRRARMSAGQCSGGTAREGSSGAARDRGVQSRVTRSA